MCGVLRPHPVSGTGTASHPHHRVDIRRTRLIHGVRRKRRVRPRFDGAVAPLVRAPTTGARVAARAGDLRRYDAVGAVGVARLRYGVVHVALGPTWSSRGRTARARARGGRAPARGPLLVALGRV